MSGSSVLSFIERKNTATLHTTNNNKGVMEKWQKKQDLELSSSEGNQQ
jgi:hypothetical protein